MLLWFPEEIRYDRSLGTVQILCPGCRERGLILVAVAAVNGFPWLAYLVMAALFLGVFRFHHRLIRLRTLAEVKTPVSRFTSHFGVSLDQLVQAGLRDGGDFKVAAQFLRSYF